MTARFFHGKNVRAYLDFCQSFALIEAFFVKRRVERVEVLFVQLVGQQTKVLAEALIVDDLALPQEAYSVAHVVVIAEAEDVVVGRSGLLL